jgi:hypothetical protein
MNSKLTWDDQISKICLNVFFTLKRDSEQCHNSHQYNDNNNNNIFFIFKRSISSVQVQQLCFEVVVSTLMPQLTLLHVKLKKKKLRCYINNFVEELFSKSSGIFELLV